MAAPDRPYRPAAAAQGLPEAFQVRDSGQAQARPRRRLAADLFSFVQLDLPGATGLGEGRYLARTPDDDAESVLVVRQLDVPRPPRRVRKLNKGAGEPTSLAMTRVTAVSPHKLGGEAEAAEWLRTASKDEDAQAALLAGALLLLNRAVHAQRAASADQHLADVGPGAAVATRIGYGSGDDVAEGRWREAIELPEARKRRDRRAAIAPQGRIAAVLGGRESVDPCEALVLRARLDLDHGRPREAALQLRVGVEAVLAEVSPTGAGEGQAEDLASLTAQRQAVGAAANAALKGPLGAEDAKTVSEALNLAERVLRRRALRAG